jgi:hypothetical protein
MEHKDKQINGITPLEIEYYHGLPGLAIYRFLFAEKAYICYIPKSKLDRCIDKILECS